jgi:hypothetical protein
MTGYCKGYCDRLPSFDRYVDGFKFCATCEKFIQVGEARPGVMLKCPCCHRQVRIRGKKQNKHSPRNKVYY